MHVTVRHSRLRLARSIVFLFVCMGVLVPGTGSAFSPGDVAQKLTEVTGLQGLVRGLAQGASEPFKKDAEDLLDNKITPLLSRADAVLRSNIDHAADRAMDLLLRAESALNDVLDHVNLVGESLIHDFFANLNASLDRVFAEVDDLICSFAPRRDGLEISGIPFVKAFDEIRVRRPAQTQCYRNFPGSFNDPSAATFTGYQYYLGETCELELDIQDLAPDDPRSIAKSARGYEQLAGLVKAGMCSAPTAGEKKILIDKELTFERRAAFFRALEDGTSTALRVAPNW